MAQILTTITRKTTLCSFERTAFARTPKSQTSGDHAGGVPPVSISNTEVKTSRADDTWGASSWQSRSSPGNKRKDYLLRGSLFAYFCCWSKNRGSTVRQAKGVSYSRWESYQKRLASHSVSSLESYRVTCDSKRRQLTSRPETKAEVVEPRNPRMGRLMPWCEVESNIVRVAIGETCAASPGS